MKPDISLLLYPFQEVPPVYINQVRAITDEIIEEYSDIHSTLKSKYKKSDFGGLTARFFPYSNLNVLRAASRHMALFFFFDDLYGTKNLEELHSAAEEALNALDGQSINTDNEIFRQFSQLYRELSILSTPSWMFRYNQAIKQYFQALLAEAYFSEKGMYPTTSYYMLLREDIVGLRQLVLFLELDSDVSLPFEIYTHPYIKRISTLAVRVMAFANDFYSAPKEMQDGEIFNLVLVIMAEQNCSLQEAYNATILVHNNDMIELLTLFETKPTAFADNVMVTAYINQIKAMIYGHIIWTEKSFRYTSAF